MTNTKSLVLLKKDHDNGFFFLIKQSVKPGSQIICYSAILYSLSNCLYKWYLTSKKHCSTSVHYFILMVGFLWGLKFLWIFHFVILDNNTFCEMKGLMNVLSKAGLYFCVHLSLNLDLKVLTQALYFLTVCYVSELKAFVLKNNFLNIIRQAISCKSIAILQNGSIVWQRMRFQKHSCLITRNNCWSFFRSVIPEFC